MVNNYRTANDRTMADQNLPMSDKITTIVGHCVRPIWFLNSHRRLYMPWANWLSYTLLRCNVLLCCHNYKLQIACKKTEGLALTQLKLLWCHQTTDSNVMAGQNGTIVEHCSFKGNGIICSLKIFTKTHFDYDGSLWNKQ